VRIAGIDEAGRGPLAGPVVAGAVIFDARFVQREEFGLLKGLTDSKQLSAARRESFYELLERSPPDVEIAVGIADCEEIDRLNILRATHAAMARALHGLPAPPPDFVLLDGLPVAGFPAPCRAIVGGDALSLSIAAASVVAKVVRDRLMVALDERYPAYGFAAHKGYGTAAHMRALLEHGPCPIHRRTFRPVREAAEIRRRWLQEEARGHTP
jgi:ribonuclease HII